MGLGEAEEFEARLRDEHGALEVRLGQCFNWF
jgi:hypothetical protein